jgi:2-hydroxy-6-oxonona-2,4-dienedioate hydrolase
MNQRAGHLVSRWTRVDELLLHAKRSIDEVPTGRTPLVFVHGLLVSMRYFLPAAVRMAPRYPLYTLDLPGYGKSDKPPYTPDLPCLSTLLVGWMDAVGLNRVVLIANSFGCQVATDFALRYPERVARLVLIGPTIDPARHSARQQVLSLLLDGTREPYTYARILTDDLWDMGVPRALRMGGVALRDRIEGRLPLLRIPTLVMRGARDPLVPPRWAEEATRLLPDGRLVVVPDAAHVAHYDATDAFIRLVEPFLAQAV